jgi:hypothetical protein
VQAARFCSVQNQSNHCRVLGLLDLLWHVHESAGFRCANGQMKSLLHHFDKPGEASATTGKHESGGNLRIKTGTAHFIANQCQKFLGPWLDDVGQHTREDGAGRTIADAGDFDGGVFVQERRGRATVMTFDAFSFRDRRAQADCEVVGEMVATDRHGARVANDSASIHDQFSGAATDVEEAGSKIAFVLGQASFGGRERFDDRVTDQNSSAIRGGDKILRGGHRRGDHVYVGFETLPDHADGIADAVVSVHGKFVWQYVKHFAVFGKRNVASSVNRAANVFAFDIARAIAKRYAAAAVQSAHVAAGDTDQRRFHRDAGNAFGFLDRAANRADRRIEIDNGAFAQAFRFGCAKCEKFYLFIRKLRDQNAGLGAANVQPDEIFISFRQSPPPLVYLCFCTIMCSPQPLESGFKTTWRAYCKSTDCTQPALDCHCEKFSTSIRYFPVNSLEPK